MATHQDADPAAIGRRIDAVLAMPALPAMLAAYFDPTPSNRFAGSLFDDLGTNDPEHFTADDLVAASLLDVRFGPPAARSLLRGEHDEALQAIKPSWTIEQLADDTVFAAASAAYDGLKAIDGIGPTRASKLLARKRPELVPIGDSVIVEQLRVRGLQWWRPLARALTPERLARLEEPSRMYSISRLRALDVSIWMVGSRSKGARRVRGS